MPIEKTYTPAETEARFYKKWEESGAFAAHPESKATPYTIMMPPPNVTGSLHMGHALTFTLQDSLIRYQRMRGRDALWQPGTDHASIAVHTILERQLAEKKQHRQDLGREAFLGLAWKWKEESGSTITRQLRRLGASCDWARERFTMEPAMNRGVNRCFVELFKKGLVYKDNRLVNWDPKFQSVVSDLEAIPREIKGHMWHLRYPLADGVTYQHPVKDADGNDTFEVRDYICVATTRPETMLGDGAVAVNPEDPRYSSLVGKLVRLPLTDRLIPIILDSHADPEKGSGAVKITAAHDFNDFEVWKRHRDHDYFKRQVNGGLINLFTPDARMSESAPEAYRGLDRYDARKRVIADLEALGLVDKIENIVHAVPHAERSDVVLEPYLSEQWYCDAVTLAQPAIKAVEEGRTKFVPEQWQNTYYSWMRNIQPWCISRQLWWGHQIPAWYGEDGKLFVAETAEEAQAEADKHYGRKTQLTQDPDVFDTWFSSALWPFSTLGWPDATPELARYYPGDVLVTGFDIIFFWVARMMMMGLHFMQDVPFKTVYIHALVRDEKGQKMSKTKGNVIDPLAMIDTYGCDALRLTLASLSTPGRDIRLAPARIEGYRNFATKLWNAARYCQMNECAWQKGFDPAAAEETVNQWIVGAVKQAADSIAAHLDAYRFDLAAQTAYEFVWNNFCDWYLEFTKPVLTDGTDAAKAETRATTAWVLGQMLHFLHPFMPYITEELWEQFTGAETGMLITAAWPTLSDTLIKSEAATEMDWLIRLISSIRTVRAELNVPASAKVPLQIKDAAPATTARLTRHSAIIHRMARLSAVTPVTTVGKGSAQAILDEATLILPLADVIDLEQERARLSKESEKWSAEIKKIDAKLGNSSFVDKAPPEVVEEHRERKAEAEAMLAKLEAACKSLAG